MRKLNSLGTAMFFAVILIFLKTVLAIIANGFNSDFIWCLQVLNRLCGGQVLYRDIFFGVTPLSIYLVQGIASLGFGAEAVCVILVAIFSQLLTVFFCLMLARRFGFQQLFLLTITIVTLTDPWIWPPYTPLAMMFLVLACFYLVRLSGNCQITPKPLQVFAAGLVVGLCFCAKQNLGALIFLGALLSFLFTVRNKDRAGEGSVILPFVAGFAVIGILCLLPVIFTGAFSNFTDYCFLGKGKYLSRAGFSYIQGLFSFKTPKIIIFWLPVLCLIACLKWWKIRRSESNLILILVLFVLSASANAFPRADYPHFNFAAPFLITVFAVALSRINPIINRFHIKLSLIFFLIILSILPQWRGITGLVCEKIILSKTPHLKWFLVKKGYIDEWESFLDELPQMRPQPTLFLFADAAKAYLATGMTNSTPYDYPLSTAFGLNGEEGVIEQIKRKEITQVVVGKRYGEPRLNPERLLGFVETKMEYVEGNEKYKLFAVHKQQVH